MLAPMLNHVGMVNAHKVVIHQLMSDLGLPKPLVDGRSFVEDFDSVRAVYGLIVREPDFTKITLSDATQQLVLIKLCARNKPTKRFRLWH